MSLFYSYRIYENLINRLKNHLDLPESLVKAALKYNRANFLPQNKRQFACIDAPIPITNGQTTSQPTTVLYMLKVLNPVSGSKVLEIGTGTGWQTAILADLVSPNGKVYSYEINSTMYKLAKHNLAKLRIKNIHLFNENVFAADNKHSPHKYSPFDRIIAGASFSDNAIKSLLTLLSENGIAVIPHIANGLVVHYNKKPEPKTYFIKGFVFVRGKE